MLKFLALLVDLLVIGFLKVIFRRRRPAFQNNKLLLVQVPGDQFSFPSGHTSRAFLLLIFSSKTGLNDYIYFVCIFAIVAAASRIVIGRHFFSDVTVGTLLGLLEGELIRCLWVDQSDWLLLRSWIWSFTPYEILNTLNVSTADAPISN